MFGSLETKYKYADYGTCKYKVQIQNMNASKSLRSSRKKPITLVTIYLFVEPQHLAVHCQNLEIMVFLQQRHSVSQDGVVVINCISNHCNRMWAEFDLSVFLRVLRFSSVIKMNSQLRAFGFRSCAPEDISENHLVCDLKLPK